VTSRKCKRGYAEQLLLHKKPFSRGSCTQCLYFDISVKKGLMAMLQQLYNSLDGTLVGVPLLMHDKRIIRIA
jgi:hypothetical protein